MGGLEVKSFAQPDTFQKLPRFMMEEVVVGGVHVARTVLEPGWSWAEDMKPIAGTPSCVFHHQGFILTGHVQFETDEGAHRLAGPGDVFDVPPGHNAWVVGDEPVVSVEFAGVRGFGRPADSGERVVSTLLVTDIVESTAVAARMGDVAWKELLGRHNDRVRLELDRFRGHEVTRPATVSSPCSMERRERFAAPPRFTAPPSWTSSVFVRVSTPARSSDRRATSAASRYTSPPESRP